MTQPHRPPEAMGVAERPPLDLILITGMSGSGKSVALHALEDAGYYCVDNLPPELLQPFVALESRQSARRLAIAMDVRSATSLHLVPDQLAALGQNGLNVQVLFLDASTDTLVRRYSETRRRHPLSKGDAPDLHQDQQRALTDAIELERALLAGLRERSHLIDTTMLRAAQLRSYVKAIVSAPAQLTLVFESFAYKRGVPTDADFAFDVRMLPNPHYEPHLRALTGRDALVADFLHNQPEVQKMLQHLIGFLEHWLPAMAEDHRSYVTVAIGCTGGQHRSVYLVEQLHRHFATQWTALKRHREIDAG